jgi:putative ABC transport system substrate-binding protein
MLTCRPAMMLIVVVAFGLSVGSLTATAQLPRPFSRLGFLAPTRAPSSFYEVFRQSLRELGYVEGQNLIIEHRSATSRSQLAELAMELVRLEVDVIVAPGGAADEV